MVDSVRSAIRPEHDVALEEEKRDSSKSSPPKGCRREEISSSQAGPERFNSSAMPRAAVTNARAQRSPGSQPLTPPGEISGHPLRSTVMSNLIPAVATILIVMMAFGFPSLAIVIGRYFKMRERELALEMEYRQKSQQQQLAIEERVQHIEDALTRLDHDVRVRLGEVAPS
jgi:hypothetical protein